eukprot:scaffold10650_cov169-Amphora_coffeaeformis.AAC.8
MSMQRLLDRLGQNSQIPNNDHIRGFSSGSNGSEEDCSWCDEFDRGPCRVPFRLWMQCCDFHPETYAQTCKKTFQNFNKCLERAETTAE